MRNVSVDQQKVINTFLDVTSHTVPPEYEGVFIKEKLEPRFAELNVEHIIDQHGNVFVHIPLPDGSPSRVMFTSHLDDVSGKRAPVVHQFDGRYISTDGTTILGADCKAGLALMLTMIEHTVPGTYAFFSREESGCVGSSAVAHILADGYDKIISFDRKAHGSIITHQSWGCTASDRFAEVLSNELAQCGVFYEADNGGIYTDSNSFAEYVSECTNLSTGMYNCHLKSERLDALYLVTIAVAFCSIDWEELPTFRDPSQHNTRRYRTPYYSGHAARYGYGHSTFEDDWYYDASEGYRLGGATGRIPRQDEPTFIDTLEEDEWDMIDCEICGEKVESYLTQDVEETMDIGIHVKTVCDYCNVNCRCQACGVLTLSTTEETHTAILASDISDEELAFFDYGLLCINCLGDLATHTNQTQEKGA